MTVAMILDVPVIRLSRRILIVVGLQAARQRVKLVTLVRLFLLRVLVGRVWIVTAIVRWLFVLIRIITTRIGSGIVGHRMRGYRQLRPGRRRRMLAIQSRLRHGSWLGLVLAR